MRCSSATAKSSGPTVLKTDDASAPRWRARERGQTAVLVLIVVAILIAVAWWLIRSRQQSEVEAKNFVRDTATRLAFDLDRKVLDRAIAPEQVAKYPPSFRERVIEKFRGFGRPTSAAEVEGDLFFTNYFFQPSGNFRARFTYPTMPVVLHLAISRPKGWWQINELNISWEQPPPPAPSPVETTPAPQPQPGG